MPFNFETSITLGDTDAAGRIFFARAFDKLHLAYEALMESLGFPLAELLRAGKIVLPIIKADAEYKKPLVLGEKITIRTKLMHLGTSSFSFEHEFLSSGNLAVKAITVHVCVDLNGTKRELPGDLRNKLEEFKGLILI